MNEPGFLRSLELETRVRKLESSDKAKKKDVWDKLGAASGLISGILVALIGFYATNIYDSRAKEAENAEKERNTVAIELQTIEKFLPHLASSNEVEKQVAIEAVSSLGNSVLATKMAKIVGGAGARAALANIAESFPQAKYSATVALTELYMEFRESVGEIETECLLPSGEHRKVQGTFFLITKSGYALTAFHSAGFEPCSKPAINIPSLGPNYQAHLQAEVVRSDQEHDLALIRLPAGDYKPVKLANQRITTGDAIIAIGFPKRQGLIATTGTVISDTGLGGQLLVEPKLLPGSAGSPIFNSGGEVIGVAVRNLEDNSAGVVVPSRFIQPLLAIAGASAL